MGQGVADGLEVTNLAAGKRLFPITCGCVLLVLPKFLFDQQP